MKFTPTTSLTSDPAPLSSRLTPKYLNSTPTQVSVSFYSMLCPIDTVVPLIEKEDGEEW